MNTTKRVLAAVAIGVVLVRPQLARAIPPFWEQFEAKYVKKGATDEKQKALNVLLTETKCNVCHVMGQEKKVRNRYGTELAKLLNKKDFTKERLQAEPEKAK